MARITRREMRLNEPLQRSCTRTEEPIRLFSINFSIESVINAFRSWLENASRHSFRSPLQASESSIRSFIFHRRSQNGSIGVPCYPGTGYFRTAISFKKFTNFTTHSTLYSMIYPFCLPNEKDKTR